MAKFLCRESNISTAGAIIDFPIDPLPRRGRVRHRQRVTKCDEAWFSAVNADFETEPAVRLSRPGGSSDRPPFQPLLGDDAITSGSLCQIKRGSAAFDQLRRRFSWPKLRNPDRYGDRRQQFAGRPPSDPALRHRATNPLGDSFATGKIRARKDCDQFLATKSGRKIVLSYTLAKCGRH